MRGTSHVVFDVSFWVLLLQGASRSNRVLSMNKGTVTVAQISLNEVQCQAFATGAGFFALS